MRLIRAILAASLCAASARAQAWEFEAGLLFADLSDRTYADKISTNRFFDAGYGLDLSVRKSIWQDFAVEAGANTILFDGREGDPFAAAVRPDRIAAHAAYAGVRFSPRMEGGWGVYTRLDAGLSVLEDVRHDVARGGVEQGTETSLAGGQDLYLGFGAGLTFRVDDRWDVNFGWEARHYGRLDGREDPAVQQVPTRDLLVVASGFRLAATYRF